MWTRRHWFRSVQYSVLIITYFKINILQSPGSRSSMHGMASDRHVMAWHGRIAAHRARHGAARRHPSEFDRKDYGPTGEQNPTPPDRATDCRFGKSSNFPSRLTGSHLQLGGSDFLRLQGHSLCCEMQVDIYIQICI